MLLEDRVALITGASRGIGRAMATTFAAEGAAVVICGRSEQIDEVANEIRTSGGQATAVRGDIRDEAFIRDLIARCRAEHRRLDVLVNNAGVLHQGLLGMVTSQNVRETFEVNILAMIGLTQYAIRLMDAARSPSIVNVASIGGTHGLEGASIYSASKGAVIAFTRSSAKELARKGIRVNAIAPGFIDTEMTRELSEKWHAKRLESIAMGRAGTAREVADVALFLASNLSSYVTGQVVGVDGGMAA